MKVAVSASGRDLESPIDPRFGRCAAFLIVETDDMGFEAFDNENASLGGGAGIQSAQLVASKGARAVITGNCGPNAVQTLIAAGIGIYVGQAGTVREGVERFKRGELTRATGPNVADHYGMGGGRGMGMGGGRGMGMGGGRGMSGAPGTGPWAQPGAGQDDVRYSRKEPDLQDLKARAQDLARQMAEVQELIKRLDKGK